MVTTLDIYGNTHSIPVEQLVWRPSVYGIVVENGRILLSPQFKGKYDLPGGGIELGESLEEALFREIKEETGIEVKNPHLIDVRSNFFTFAHSNGESYHSIMLYYICEFAGGELSKDGFDEDEKKYADLAQWIPLEEASKVEVASSVDWRAILRKHYENTRN